MKALLAPLGLPDTADEPAALAALSTLIGERDALKASLEAATATAATAAPLSLVSDLQGQIAALQAATIQREAEGLIQAGLADGRILPALEPWARDLAATSLTNLKAYLDKATPVAALSGTQTGGHIPAGVAGGSQALNADELAVCSAMGFTPEQFIKARAAEQGN